MRLLQLLPLFLLCIATTNLQAQTETPKGYKKGSIVLNDNSMHDGFIKQSISRDASIVFLNAKNKKNKYDGFAIRSALIDTTIYLCIEGDFFEVVSPGDLTLLQKQSDVSGKALFNGSEPIFIKAKEGSKGDYFIYHTQRKELLLVNKKNGENILSLFSNHAAAINFLKQNAADADSLKLAINIYNSHPHQN